MKAAQWAHWGRSEEVDWSEILILGVGEGQACRGWLGQVTDHFEC